MDAWTRTRTLLGFRSLNLLNGNGDPSLCAAMLYLTVAARTRAGRAASTYVRVVINGESWGVFPNVEQVNKDFIQTWYKTGMARGGRCQAALAVGAASSTSATTSALQADVRDQVEGRAEVLGSARQLTKTLNQTPPTSSRRRSRPCSTSTTCSSSSPSTSRS